MAEIIGSDDPDTLNGTAEDDEIYSLDGNDTVYGKEGDDWINAIYSEEDQQDLFQSYSGTLIAYGGLGNDLISGKTGIDRLYGEDGNDRLYAWEGDDFIEGGDGNDFADGGDGDDALNGGDGDDALHGNLGADELVGGNGDDHLRGGEGDDVLEGGVGDDFTDGGDGNDTLNGGDGNDTLWGGLGTDELIGGSGDDHLEGGGGDDVLNGGPGDDTLWGGDGDDTYFIQDFGDIIEDSSGNDTAIVSVSFVKIPSSIENVTFVDGAQPFPYWIDALMPGIAAGFYYLKLLGDEKILRYAFPSSAPTYLSADEATGFRQLSSIQQRNVEIALNNIAQVIDISFERTNTSDQSNTISIALNQQTTAGVAFYPGERRVNYDVLLSDYDENATLNRGTFGAYTLVHELGHALGLKHPFEGTDGEIGEPPYLQSYEDRTQWTMMSYTTTSNENKLTFSPLDIAALQYLYGPSRQTRTGDDTYIYTPSLANFIWDGGGGQDTIDASTSPWGVTIYLEPGYQGFNSRSGKTDRITSPGQITVNYGSEIENLIGTAHTDQLVGNDLDNEIHGRDGDDSIIGDAGDDMLDGGGGNDRLQGGDGWDILIGGDGLDYALFDSNRDAFIISLTADGVTEVAAISAAENGTDILRGVERLVFSDISIAYDMDGHAGVTAKVLGAFLGAEGLLRTDLAGQALEQLDRGTSLDALLLSALDIVFGTNRDGAHLVGHFYTAVTGEEAPDDVISYWGGRVDNGELSALELSKLVAEHELNLANINFTGLYSTGIEYLTA
ncbi:MAG: M12 family metallo-peptidase [Gammaproteobacteria bacterium]|nr:M12 family metallo-peptidase [Gammaproteobacteria bacterium]MCY4357403.1 M12 family metallo-peptidase [Gammaproteobacteria bacterium]